MTLSYINKRLGVHEVHEIFLHLLVNKATSIKGDIDNEDFITPGTVFLSGLHSVNKTDTVEGVARELSSGKPVSRKMA